MDEKRLPNGVEILPTDGYRGPLAPILELLCVAAVGTNVFRKTVLALVRGIIQLMDLSFDLGKGCPGVELHVSDDKRVITLIVSTDNPWQKILNP